MGRWCRHKTPKCLPPHAVYRHNAGSTVVTFHF